MDSEQTSTDQRKRLIITATDKGGVGKTHVMTNIIQYILEEAPNTNFQCYDPDESNQSLVRFHKQLVETVDPTDKVALDEIAAAIINHHQLVLVDALGSQQTQIFQEWIEDVGIIQLLKEKNIDCTYLLIVSDEQENLAQVRSIMNRVGNQVDWLLVKNRCDKRFIKNPNAKKSSNDLWAISGARKEALEMGAIELLFEDIPGVFGKFLNKHFLTVSKAAEHQTSHGDVVGAQRYRMLWNRMKAEIKKAESIILPKS